MTAATAADDENDDDDDDDDGKEPSAHTYPPLFIKSFVKRSLHCTAGTGGDDLVALGNGSTGMLDIYLKIDRNHPFGACYQHL